MNKSIFFRRLCLFVRILCIYAVKKQCYNEVAKRAEVPPEQKIPNEKDRFDDEFCARYAGVRV